MYKLFNPIEISMTLEEIQSMKETTFKKKVLEACKKATFKQLLLKQQKRRDESDRSKGNKIKYKRFGLQTYLKSDKISATEAKLLFKIRTNMLDVKNNYRQKYSKNDKVSDEILLCQLSENHVDSEENIFQCTVLENDTDVKFENLFSENIDKVSKVLKQFKKLWRKRQDLLNQ